jgi:hypothetical protein
MYTAESSLLSPAIGTAEQWVGVVAKRNPTDAEAVVRAYFDLAPRVFINADLALAQCMLETGWLTSELFKTRRNMAGLGITGPGVLGEDFETIERGVQAHYAHLCCYTYTQADCPIERGLNWRDPRHFFHDGTPALSELKGAKHAWATDPGYIDKIVRLVNAALTEMGRLTGQAPDETAILERAYEADKARLGGKRFAGLLRRAEFGDGAGDAYPMLVCERGVLIVVGGQARDVTARCLDDFIADNERRGAFQRL